MPNDLLIFQKIPHERFDMREFLNAVEKCLIEQALEMYNFNRTLAANHLLINRTTLLMKMRNYQIGPYNPESRTMEAKKGK